MRQWTVDAFASRPFTGNPAAVVEPLDAWPDDGWMQSLAEENKHAETAFLRKTGEAHRFDLRWFTPSKEVELCGHATLASAHVLCAEMGLDAPEIAFETRWSGRLGVVRRGDGYVLDLPAAAATPVAPPAGLAEALGAAPVQVCESRYLLVVLADEAGVRGLRPDFSALARFGESAGARGNVIVCAQADAERPSRAYRRTRRRGRLTASWRPFGLSGSGGSNWTSTRPSRAGGPISAARWRASGSRWAARRSR